MQAQLPVDPGLGCWSALPIKPPWEPAKVAECLGSCVELGVLRAASLAAL
jgi:hypothetical protein